MAVQKKEKKTVYLGYGTFSSFSILLFDFFILKALKIRLNKIYLGMFAVLFFSSVLVFV